jgi:hypothetical protein
MVAYVPIARRIRPRPVILTLVLSCLEQMTAEPHVPLFREDTTRIFLDTSTNMHHNAVNSSTRVPRSKAACLQSGSETQDAHRRDVPGLL